MTRVRWALYWCETPDHDEDWFVIARTAREARRFFELDEGYDPGDAEASRICGLPEGDSRNKPGWAQLDLLARCGGKIVQAAGVRIVEIRGVVYTEGRFDYQLDQLNDDVFQQAGQGRPNGTVRGEWN